MAVKLKWPILGIIIPCLLISILGYGSHFFVFRHHMDPNIQIGFEASLTMLWISYLLAIYTDPGTTPDTFEPAAGEWRRWCKKCQKYKPERAHHCKMCKKCVLKMDHHCPWTYNCVGHKNMPHFMRFLVWILVNTGFVMVHLWSRTVEFYHDRNLPSYLVDKTELTAVIVLLPLDFFVFAAILILYVREIANWVIKGMTQIELWEWERIDSQFYTERIWLQIRRNYVKLYGKEMPVLTSWNNNSKFYEVERQAAEQEARELEDIEEETEQDLLDEPQESLVPGNFTIDDLLFPYDLGIWGNIVQAYNYPWMWILPWSGPRGDGVLFDKGEFEEDDQLGLPWPPDGGHQEFEPDSEVDLDTLDPKELKDLKKLRKNLDPRSRMDRREWINDLGEKLDDFGVDLDAEDENDELIKKSE